MFLKVYNVTGESQVLAAAKFLRGEAEEWWHGLQATGRHRQIQTLGQLHQELRKRFFPLDRLERLAKQWVMLRQQGGVEEYREEFCLLQAAYPLGERAEFMLAYQGLKPMMRAEIRQALDDGGQDQIPCERLFTLARKAEVRSFREDYTHTVTARDALRNHKKGTNSTGNRVTSGQQRNSAVHQHKNTSDTRGNTTRTGNSDRAGLLKEYPCWVCDQKGHFTRDCPHAKKQGCFRCGESHTLARLSQASRQDSGDPKRFCRKHRRPENYSTVSRAEDRTLPCS